MDAGRECPASAPAVKGCPLFQMAEIAVHTPLYPLILHHNRLRNGFSLDFGNQSAKNRRL